MNNNRFIFSNSKETAIKNLSDETLLQIYNDAIHYNVDKDFIKYLLEEINERNIQLKP